jgi:DNA-binding NarL/FixJ family response regulator
VVTDVRMPPGFSDEGLRAAVALRKTHPGLAVLVLSQYIEKTYAGELLDSGDGTGVGYLLKDRVGDVAEFIDALQRVAAGGTVVDPEVVRRRPRPCRLGSGGRQAHRAHPNQARPAAGRRRPPPRPRRPLLPPSLNAGLPRQGLPPSWLTTSLSFTP